MGRQLYFYLGELLRQVGPGLIGSNCQAHGLGPWERPGREENQRLPPPTRTREADPAWLGPWRPSRSASGIKAPEERGHSHHQQSVQVDYTGPARVLTDVLQPPGVGRCLLLGGQWAPALPAAAHPTEPQQALAEQAWCPGLGLCGSRGYSERDSAPPAPRPRAGAVPYPPCPLPARGARSARALRSGLPARQHPGPPAPPCCAGD